MSFRNFMRKLDGKDPIPTQTEPRSREHTGYAEMDEAERIRRAIEVIEELEAARNAATSRNPVYANTMGMYDIVGSRGSGVEQEPGHTSSERQEGNEAYATSWIPPWERFYRTNHDYLGGGDDEL